MDLNSDVGESFGAWRMGDDTAVLPHVSSANVACGFHAGDPPTARTTCALAARHGVVVGAHVSYRDLAGFGRRFLDVEPAELTDEVVYQIGALQALARSAGTAVRYVKPHGALYNAIVHHEQHAAAVVRAVVEVDPTYPLLALPGSAVGRLAERAGLRVVLEAFPDRGYTADGRLVPRTAAGAVLHEPADVASRAVRIAVDGTVPTADGGTVRLDVESLCVHGDTPRAVAVAAATRAALDAAGVPVSGFLPP
ncbi:LamB/YcsF family protein [Actinotalea sp. Marseille-Q4924]|uniref:LamB/YcsF family protein n=1 Tax=Actinotalea sp. Marseille-Q4924 TaxID=2866571 RepID=UPI001CE3C8BB|nr:5-oxoprolinase subunit PxpA [Actinotalea sp. Marseille-Q4924]